MAFDWTLTNAFLAIGIGAPIDSEMIQEIRDNISQAAAPIVGNSTFNSTAGSVITIPVQSDSSFFVAVTPSASPGGNLGEVWVVVNSATQFTVYNSGSATTGFRYAVQA